jgi:hypothetical protein
MTKEQFTEKEKALNEQIKVAREQISELTKEYLESRREFPDGAKIKITVPDTTWTALGGKNNGQQSVKPSYSKFAYVAGMKVTYQNEPEYILKAVKKDGTISSRNEYYSKEDKLELAQ